MSLIFILSSKYHVIQSCLYFLLLYNFRNAEKETVEEEKEEEEEEELYVSETVLTNFGRIPKP